MVKKFAVDGTGSLVQTCHRQWYFSATTTEDAHKTFSFNCCVKTSSSKIMISTSSLLRSLLLLASIVSPEQKSLIMADDAEDHYHVVRSTDSFHEENSFKTRLRHLNSKASKSSKSSKSCKSNKSSSCSGPNGDTPPTTPKVASTAAPVPTACAESDEKARSCIRRIKEAWLRVPGEIALGIIQDMELCKTFLEDVTDYSGCPGTSPSLDCQCGGISFLACVVDDMDFIKLPYSCDCKGNCGDGCVDEVRDFAFCEARSLGCPDPLCGTSN